jgi:serine/threonine-protein kinase
MAEVQLALQRGPAGFEKLVVVKLVHDSLASQKAFVDMLLDEARVAALVKHPNVVDIYDLGQAEGRYFIAMEYLEGEPLLAVLRAGREGKRLDALSTGRIIADTAEGLDAAHELRSMSGERLELVHHDISLGNIVVLYNGQVKLVDFGVAKATQSAGPKAKVQGKFSYMAPEKLKGQAGDRRSDIFSLGCVMWEALTLKRLFRGGNDGETMKQVLEMAVQPPSKINGDVPPEYDEIVMRALDRDPDRRQMTAKELAVEIEELLRKRGYGAKNDRVAKYMQETFKSHIDARKKLVQEVVAKGSASAEVVDAAFRDGTPSNGTSAPVAGRADFTLSRITPVAGVPVPVVPNQFADSSTATEISRSPFEVQTNTEVGSAPAELERAVAQHAVGDVPKPSLITRVRDFVEEVFADKQKRTFIAITAGVLVVIAILLVATHGGGSESRAANPIVGSGSGSAIVATGSGSDTPSMVGSDTGSASDVGSGSAATGSDHGSASDHVGSGSAGSAAAPDHTHRPPPPQPRVNAQEQWQKAFQAFVKGDAKTALGLLKTAKAANPNYAPNWRLLGQVYKKLGDKTQAKAAFTRYLQLAPTANDAATIKKEIEQL